MSYSDSFPEIQDDFPFGSPLIHSGSEVFNENANNKKNDNNNNNNKEDIEPHKDSKRIQVL